MQPCQPGMNCILLWRETFVPLPGSCTAAALALERLDGIEPQVFKATFNLILVFIPTFQKVNYF